MLEMQCKEPLVCGAAVKLYIYAIKYVQYTQPPRYYHIIILFLKEYCDQTEHPNPPEKDYV